MTGRRRQGQFRKGQGLCGSQRPCERIPLHETARHGFIMVEVAIAVLVLAFGVLAVFTLFSTGLDQPRKSSADTRVAMFANSVLAAINDESANHSGSAWTNYWTLLCTGQTNIQPPFIYSWSTNNNAIPGDGTLVTNAYEVVATTSNYFSHALRCSMTVTFRPGGDFPDDDTSSAAVTLRVWEGFFGSTSDVDAAVFYTEYPNAGH